MSASADAVYEALKLMEKRFEDPKVKGKFAGYSVEIQFIVKDTGEAYVMRIENGERILVERGSVENPKISVTVDSKTLVDLINRRINGVMTYMSGKLKVKGPMQDLLKLQYLM